MSLKLFKFTCGLDEKIGVFKDEKEAYERRTEVDPTFHFLPVQIDEITVPGYEIAITPIKQTVEPMADDEFTAMDRKALLDFLKTNSVEYKPHWGEQKLLDAARAWKSAQS